MFSVDRKIPTLGATVRQASFPTGTVGPRVGIFLYPLNTNDGFCLFPMDTNDLTYTYLTRGTDTVERMQAHNDVNFTRNTS